MVLIGIDAQLVIDAVAFDEDFGVAVVIVDVIVMFDVRAPDFVILVLEAGVEVIIVPQQRDTRIEHDRRAGIHFDERRRPRSTLPHRFVEAAVDGDRLIHPQAIVFGYRW